MIIANIQILLGAIGITKLTHTQACTVWLMVATSCTKWYQIMLATAHKKVPHTAGLAPSKYSTKGVRRLKLRINAKYLSF